jgi:uncharacterized protein RhaS with RHS repeats
METITVEFLKKQKACTEAINLLERNGITSFEASTVKGDFGNYRAWLLGKLKSTYDVNGNCLTFEDSNGVSGTSTYDGNGNCLTYETSNGYSWVSTYDVNGNCLTFKNNEGVSWTRTYDVNGNCLTYEDSNGYLCTRTYDVNGN